MKKGFTLLELLVSVAIFIGVLGIGISSISLQVTERRRLSRDINLNQNLKNIIEGFKREVLDSNGSEVYPVLKGLYVSVIVDDLNKLPLTEDNLVCLSSGLANIANQSNSNNRHYPTVDDSQRLGGDDPCKNTQAPFPVAFLVSSKKVEGKEYLYLRTFYVDKVSRSATSNRFEEHNAIFYDEYLFQQNSFRENYSSNFPANLPGAKETFPLTDTRKTVQLTSDNIDVKKFRLYARPSSCLTSIPSSWAEHIKEVMEGSQFTDIMKKELSFFAPLNPQYYQLSAGGNIDLYNNQPYYIFQFQYQLSSNSEEMRDPIPWFNANFDLNVFDSSGNLKGRIDLNQSQPKYILSECKSLGAPLLRVELEIASTPFLFEGTAEKLPFYEKGITAKETVDLSFPF